MSLRSEGNKFVRRKRRRYVKEKKEHYHPGFGSLICQKIASSLRKIIEYIEKLMEQSPFILNILETVLVLKEIIKIILKFLPELLQNRVFKRQTKATMEW